MIGEADHALERLRAWVSWLPRPSGSRADPIEDLLTVIDAAVTEHVHRVVRDGEALEARPGTEAPGEIARLRKIIVDWWNDPDNPPVEAVRVVNEEQDRVVEEGRRRPGKAVPDPMVVLGRVQDALVIAGVAGYAPLSVDEGVRTLGTLLERTQDQLAIAQASTRQHLEASSHRAQIAEHYRQALFDLHREVGEQVTGTSTGLALNDAMVRAYRAAATPPEWDGKVRP